MASESYPQHSEGDMSKVELSALAVPVAVCLLHFPCWDTQILKSHAPLTHLGIELGNFFFSLKIKIK